MTPRERRMFMEFLKSIQSIEALRPFIKYNIEQDISVVSKLAQLLGPGAYMEGLDEDEKEMFQDKLKEVPLASNGGDVDRLFYYLEGYEVSLSPEVEEFVRNNYTKITPELISQKEMELQNELIEEYQLETGLSKEQAVQYVEYINSSLNDEARHGVFNAIGSALCQHPEIKKLELEKTGKLDEHARQVITDVCENIKNGKDNSGLFFPYVDVGDPNGIKDPKGFYSVNVVQDVLEMWQSGIVRPVAIKKMTPDGIKNEFLEGVHLKLDGGKKDLFIKKTEEELRNEELRKEAEKEEDAKDYTLNHKEVSAETAFAADEDDITFYKECFEKVPNLSKTLFGTEKNPVRLSELSIEQCNQLILEAFNMVNKVAKNDEIAEDKKMSYDDYDLGSIRNLFRYAAAKQDGMLAENDEYKIDDLKINSSKTENKKYIDELDKIVMQSDLFKQHLANPVPTYEETDGSFLKTYEKNKKQYIDKLNNSFDYLSKDKKNELMQEAEKLSKNHPYINGTDIMKYLIHQESEILRLYNECVDPDGLDDSLRERYSAPFTLEAIGRGVGIRAKAFELKKQEDFKREDLQAKLLGTKGADTYVQFADAIKISLEQGLVVTINEGADKLLSVSALTKDAQGKDILVCSDNDGREIKYDLLGLFYDSTSEYTSVNIRDFNAPSQDLMDRVIDIEQLRNAKREEVMNEILQSDTVQKVAFGSKTDMEKRAAFLRKPANQLKNNKNMQAVKHTFNKFFVKACENEINAKYGIECMQDLRIDKDQLYDKLVDLQTNEIGTLEVQPSIKEEVVEQVKEYQHELETKQATTREIIEEKPVMNISENQVSSFTDEIVRLTGRLNDSHSKKHNNSDTYKDLKEKIDSYIKPGKIASVDNLKGALKELTAAADSYLADHANERPGLFKTFGKARQERIKTCARIKVMNDLVANGIAYDSTLGRTKLLACKLVCAEYIAKGFTNGFKALCQDGAIERAIQNKLDNPEFKAVADQIVNNDKAYDMLVKQSGDKCLKTCNAMAETMKKNGEIKEQVKEPSVNVL